MKILLYLAESEHDLPTRLGPIAESQGAQLLLADSERADDFRPQVVLVSEDYPGGFFPIAGKYDRIQVPVYVLTARRGLGIYNQVRAAGGKGIIPLMTAPEDFAGLLNRMGSDGGLSKGGDMPKLGNLKLAPGPGTSIGPLAEPVQEQAQPAAAPDKRIGLGSQIITVFGFKGGIGKSTLAANLAVKLASSGKPKFSVVVVDFDINAAGRLASMFHVYPSATILDWAGLKQVDDISGYLVDGPGGLKILPAPRAPHDEAAVTSEVAEKVLRILARRFDFVIVDCPMILRDSTIVALDLATQIILVAAPDRPTLQGVCDVAKTLRNLGIDKAKIHFVLNRVPRQSSFRIEDLGQDIIPYPLAASIAEDPAVQIAVNRYPDRKKFACHDGKAREFQKGFEKLSQAVNPYLRTEKGPRTSFLARLRIPLGRRKGSG